MKNVIEKHLLLISKNPLLPEIISEKVHQLSWFNANLRDLKVDADVEVIIFDSYTYGMRFLQQGELQSLPVIILDDYNEKIFISNLVEGRERAYLFIDDFIEELPIAVNRLAAGDNYITDKLLCEL